MWGVWAVCVWGCARLAAGLSEWASVPDPLQLGQTTLEPKFATPEGPGLKDRLGQWAAKRRRPETTTSGAPPGDQDVSAQEREELRTAKDRGVKEKAARKLVSKKLNNVLRPGQPRLKVRLGPAVRRARLLEGARLELICPGLNRSALLPFKWERDGLRLRKGQDRVKIKRNRNLVIAPLLRDDSGHYQCFQEEAGLDPDDTERRMFRWKAQVSLEVRGVAQGLLSGLLNLLITSAFALFLLLLWAPLFLFCIWRPSERGLSQEDEAEHRAFLAKKAKRRRPSGSAAGPASAVSAQPRASARNAVDLVRGIEASRYQRL